MFQKPTHSQGYNYEENRTLAPRVLTARVDLLDTLSVLEKRSFIRQLVSDWLLSIFFGAF